MDGGRQPDVLPAGPEATGVAAAPRVPFRRRSRVVAWAKVLLPLAALALLSTVFLLARAPAGEGGRMGDDVPFARLRAIASDPRIDAPRLAGVAADGTRVILSADRIRPLGDDAFALEAPRLAAEGPDGTAVAARAADGEVDGPAQRLRLGGGVRVEASSGYAAALPGLTADLRAGTLRGEGPVAATAPFGALAAGGLRLERPGDGRARLVFNGGVRLLYQPQRPAPDPPAGPEPRP